MGRVERSLCFGCKGSFLSFWAGQAKSWWTSLPYDFARNKPNYLALLITGFSSGFTVCGADLFSEYTVTRCLEPDKASDRI